jgi:acyl-CoA thioester hydrolase
MTYCDTEIRVRYCETDAMGVLHHARYFFYFEQGRCDLLRLQGISYRDVEAGGFYLVTSKVGCHYKAPARFDDLLRLRTILTRTTHVRVEHRYELYRGDTLLAEGHTVLACVDREGKLQALPEILRGE